MKYGLFAGAAVLALIVTMAGFLFFGYMGFSNTANRFEQDIPAQYKQMQNVYDNGWKQVMEQNQISDKYAAQFKDAFQGILRGDANGQQALINVLTAIPHFDSEVSKTVMQSVEIFHADFAASQKQLIAIKQSYGTFLFATTTGRILNTFGSYPHIRCGVPDGSDDNYQIVTSGKTESDFKTHKADALNLKGN